MALEFRLPELGENITSGTVTKVMVAAGDAVTVDQPVLELETEKAVVEVPSNIAGKVTEVRVKAGQTVNVGDVVFVAESVEAAGAVGAKPSAPRQEKVAAAPAAAATAAEKPSAEKPNAEKHSAEKPSAKKPEVPRPVPEPVEQPGEAARGAAVPPAAPAARGVPGRLALASPSVRRLARELGVDLSRVPGTGPKGRVAAEDVRASAGRAAGQPPPEQPGAPTAGHADAPAGAAEADHDHWGAIERQPMSAIRRKTALHMTAAWETIPYVTQFDKADITFLEQCRKQYAPQVESEGGRLTVTILVLKALGVALANFPKFNAVVDMENEQIIFKKYINVGLAVDTENGLLVPVVREVDRKSIIELAVEAATLAEKARARKLTLDEMQGGTFTLTNLGGIGGTGFTPIINAPEVAVLGLSRSRVEPVFSEGAFTPRTMLPLSLSYDHRIIDGADAARFTRWLAEALEQPLFLFLEET